MSDSAIERRHLLRGAGVLAGGAAAASGIGAVLTPAAARHHDDDHHHGRRLEGSWYVDVTGPDGSKTVSIGSFAAGGVALTHDIRPANPPFTGAWTMGEDDAWRATLWCGFPGEGGPDAPGVTVRLRIRGTVKEDRIRGSYSFRAYDASGAEVDFGRGTFRGRRIQP
jgi:hypothetical protein